MGNCLIVQEKIVKVMKTDGKILEYEAPIKIEQILSDYAGHTISDKIPVAQHLSHNAELLGGHLYYLLPPPIPPEMADDQKKLLGVPNAVAEGGQGAGVVKIKLVISKQELLSMLSKGSGLSVDDMISSQLEKKQGAIRSLNFDSDSDVKFKGWRPQLESIPEVN